MEKFWIVWWIGCGSKVPTHATREEAEAKAARLAAGNNTTFYVMEAMASCDRSKELIWKDETGITLKCTPSYNQEDDKSA